MSETSGEKETTMNETPSTESDAAFLNAARLGYEAAIEDVREAISESLNLAHLREALRYLRYEPRVTAPGSGDAAQS